MFQRTLQAPVHQNKDSLVAHENKELDSFLADSNKDPITAISNQNKEIDIFVEPIAVPDIVLSGILLYQTVTYYQVVLLIQFSVSHKISPASKLVKSSVKEQDINTSSTIHNPIDGDLNMMDNEEMDELNIQSRVSSHLVSLF